MIEQMSHHGETRHRSSLPTCYHKQLKMVNFVILWGGHDTHQNQIFEQELGHLNTGKACLKKCSVVFKIHQNSTNHPS